MSSPLAELPDFVDQPEFRTVEITAKNGRSAEIRIPVGLSEEETMADIEAVDKQLGELPPLEGSELFLSPSETEAEARPLGQKITDFVTGQTPSEERLPGVGSVSEGLGTFQKIKIAAGMLATPEEKSQAEIIKSTIPGVKVEKDKFGNFTIEFGKETPELEGQRFSVNPAGLDMSDVFQVIAEIGKFIPAGKFAQRGGTTVSRFLRAIFGESITQAASEGASATLGAKVDITDAAIRTGIAGLGGGISQSVTDKLIPFLRTTFRTKRFFKDGRLTEQGIDAARKAGIDPDIADEAFSTIFAKKLARQGGRPSEAEARAAAGEAFGEVFGTPLTRGQVTGDVTQRTGEEIARNIEPTREALKTFDEGQARAIESARQGIQARLGSTEARSVVEGVGVGLDALDAGRKKLVGKIDDAFEIARSKESYFTGKSMRDLGRAAGVIAKEFPSDVLLTPRARAVLKEINRLSKKANRLGRGKRNKMLSIEDFDLTRRRISKTIGGATDPADKHLSITLKDAYDDWLDDAIRQELFVGDSDAMDALKFARGKRRELTLKYAARNSNDEAGKIIENAIRIDATPEQAANAFLGANRLGGKATSAKVVGRLKETLGVDSNEFGSIKEAAFLKLTQDRSPGQIATEIPRFFRDSPSLAKELFSADETTLIKQYGELMKIVAPDKNTLNPSRTAFTNKAIVSRAVSDTLRVAQQKFVFGGKPLIGNMLGIMRRLVLGDLGKRGKALAAAREAMEPLLVNTGSLPTAIGTGLGVALTREFEE
jgi:hypothetical protein